MNRFLIIILGTATGIDKDLNFIADGEQGVNYVDGKGMFICTFYSPYTAAEIHERMVHRPAIMIFDITDPSSYGVNLPTKYFTGIFPEVQKTLDELTPSLPKSESKRMQTIVDDINKETFTKVNNKVEVEEYDSVNDILDKLSRNDYDRTCLTEKEIEILNKG